MLSQFQLKLTFMDYKSMSKKIILGLYLLLYTAFTVASQPKVAWYRYYDNRGIANISTSVSPNHIRYGYEALDQNMQVIQRNKPYNVEADIKQAPKRAAEAKQNASDLKLKQAYNNSQIAQQKKKHALTLINKQLIFQQDQLKQLQNDRILFGRQEREHFRKGQSAPELMKTIL